MYSPLTEENTESPAKQAAQPAAGGDVPRLVIRGETNTNPILRDETLLDGEKVVVRSGYKNQAILVTIPVPDESKPVNIAHIDWLGFTFKGDGSHKEH